MKYTIIAFTAFLFMASTANAQMDKTEKKRIKKELKQYKKNPDSYKSMINNYKTTIQTGENTITDLTEQLSRCAAEKTSLEQAKAQLETRLEELNKLLAACNAKVPGTIPAIGTVYKVQFGLYEHFDISDYFTSPKYIGSEKVDKYNAYMVSYFDSEEQAQLFKKDIAKMGLRDAFVAKYVDGQRIYEWEKNPKFKGKKTPASLQEAIEVK